MNIFKQNNNNKPPREKVLYFNRKIDTLKVKYLKKSMIPT